jgi:RNase P/RNase MRP subunit p30
MDLNVRIKSSTEVHERTSIVKRLAELGWNAIAWNQVVLASSPQRQHIKPKDAVSLSTVEVREVLKYRSLISTDSFAFVSQYNRITLIVDDVIDAQNITANNEHLKGFDIVAVIPGNAKVLAYLCKTADVDLICFDFTRRIPFQINKKMVRFHSSFFMFTYPFCRWI